MNNKPTLLPSMVKLSKAYLYLGVTPKEFVELTKRYNIRAVQHKGQWRYKKSDIVKMKGKYG
ncbi:MAG: helix-turn-helix domain-containing protein [bacterium]|nr:helix-turn-helix domain-containing protein [bacterium]